MGVEDNVEGFEWDSPRLAEIGEASILICEKDIPHSNEEVEASVGTTTMALEAYSSTSEGARTDSAAMARQASATAVETTYMSEADEQANADEFEPDDPEEEVKYAGDPMATPGATVMAEVSVDVAMSDFGTEALETNADTPRINVDVGSWNDEAAARERAKTEMTAGRTQRGAATPTPTMMAATFLVVSKSTRSVSGKSAVAGLRVVAGNTR